MGRRMSSAVLSRACALGFAFAIAFLALAAVVPAAKAAPNPIDPAAMTVSVVLDKSSYLSGDTASARAIVYRTPAPGNYTYVWRVRNLFFQLLNTTTTAGAVFNYPIALAYTGTLRFEATVDDGQGTVVAGQQSATVAQAYMSLTLDRGDYNPGVLVRGYRHQYGRRLLRDHERDVLLVRHAEPVEPQLHVPRDRHGPREQHPGAGDDQPGDRLRPRDELRPGVIRRRRDGPCAPHPDRERPVAAPEPVPVVPVDCVGECLGHHDEREHGP